MKEEPTAEPPEASDLPLSLRRKLAKWDIAAKFGALAVPVVLAGIGWGVTRSLGRIQAGPEFLDFAQEIIRQDPLGQPEGLREWAVDLINAYAGKTLDEDLARRLKAGWGFEVPVQSVGTFFFEPGETNVQHLDGHRFELEFVVADETDRLEGVVLSMPSTGEAVREADLTATDILRIHHGPRAYLFRFEDLNEGVAAFSIWKQGPAVDVDTPPAPGAPTPELPDP